MNGAPDRDIAVFTEALHLPFEERARFLSQACKGDAELRRRVEALLQAYEQAGNFLGRPAADRPPKAAPGVPAGEKPGCRIGHYKLLQQIGEGGCGVVYMAEQEEPVRRRVALKIIKPGMDTRRVIARFESERQALALMNHPNIAKVFDAGATEAGRPYFVMELVRGVKITEYCNQHSLTTEERLGLFVQVCQAVQHAHQRGIIHRDIKPSNILVTQSLEGVATPIVIDFGVAKATTDQRLTDKTLFTAFEMLIGTPAYMSPEQATLSSVDVDTRTDIYSLGVLLYELLTNSTPFDTKELVASGLDEMRRTIREVEPMKPSTRLTQGLAAQAQNSAKSKIENQKSKIANDLDWIVMKALEKDRTRRYETANDLALDVKRFLEHEPISACPPSRLYKFLKMVRRNRLLFISLGIIAILLIVGLIVVSASLAQALQSRREAKQVKQFLEEMLQGVGPDVALGRDTAILREILDQTASKVGRELTNQPAVEAELRSVVGTLYYRTGQYPQAEEMQRAALAIRRKRFGPASLEAAASLHELGLTLLPSGKLSEAEQADREALDIRRRRFGNQNADVATSQNNLAHVYTQMGRLAEADALAREGLATRQKLFGNDSLEVADSLRTLAVILGDQRKWAESEKTARRVLEIRRAKLGPDHTWVAAALNDLAWAAAANGKQQEAEALERDSLAMRRRLLSEEHPDVANSLYLVGDRTRQQGNLKEADSVLNAALSIQRKVLGPDNPNTLYTLKSLGLMHEAEHNWSEAESVFRKVLAAWRKRAGNDDPETLYALRNLGEALEGQGKWSEAQAAHREELAGWRKRAGNSDSQESYALHMLGVALSAQEKWSQAETVYREELELRRKQAGNGDADTLFALRNVGITLEFEGKWAEAENLHRESLDSWRKRAGNDDPQTLYTLDRLGWTLQAQSKWLDAETTYREALTSRRKKAANDTELLWEGEQLCVVLGAQRKYHDMEQLLDEALTPELLKLPSCCPLVARRLDVMGRQGKWTEAADAAATLNKYQPDEYYWLYNMSALSAATHDRPAYEKVCKRIPAAFGETTNSYVAWRLAASCLLLPNSGADRRLVQQLATKAVTLGKADVGIGYFQAGEALSEYREGGFAQAVEWAEQGRTNSEALARADSCAVLAMAQWSLGLKDAARDTLTQGNRLAPEISSDHAVDLGDKWLDWLIARILLVEAADLTQLVK